LAIAFAAKRHDTTQALTFAYKHTSSFDIRTYFSYTHRREHFQALFLVKDRTQVRDYGSTFWIRTASANSMELSFLLFVSLKWVDTLNFSFLSSTACNRASKGNGGHGHESRTDRSSMGWGVRYQYPIAAALPASSLYYIAIKRMPNNGIDSDTFHSSIVHDYCTRYDGLRDRSCK
jgi:hypothetical protein